MRLLDALMTPYFKRTGQGETYYFPFGRRRGYAVSPRTERAIRRYLTFWFVSLFIITYLWMPFFSSFLKGLVGARIGIGLPTLLVVALAFSYPLALAYLLRRSPRSPAVMTEQEQFEARQPMMELYAKGSLAIGALITLALLAVAVAIVIATAARTL